MPDHLCANSITGGVEYWLVRRYTSRDVNIQSLRRKFNFVSKNNFDITADNTKWPADGRLLQTCVTEAWVFLLSLYVSVGLLPE